MPRRAHSGNSTGSICRARVRRIHSFVSLVE